MSYRLSTRPVSHGINMLIYFLHIELYDSFPDYIRKGAKVLLVEVMRQKAHYLFKTKNSNYKNIKWTQILPYELKHAYFISLSYEK